MNDAALTPLETAIAAARSAQRTRNVYMPTAAEAAALFEAAERVADLQATFDMLWEAHQRAIRLWQTAHPGNDHAWPDVTDMVMWLMGRLENGTVTTPEPTDEMVEAALAHWPLAPEWNEHIDWGDKLRAGMRAALAAALAVAPKP